MSDHVSDRGITSDKLAPSFKELFEKMQERIAELEARVVTLEKEADYTRELRERNAAP